MRLVLMRHAEAGEADPRRWPDDRERPLTDAGRHEHARVAAALCRMGVGFDHVLTSPLVRARETADITARIYGSGAPQPTELLRDRAEPAAIVAGLRPGGAAGLLCVGHEPTLSRLAALLIGRDGSARVKMSNFLHHFDPATCERFLARAWAALAPGGRAVTVEFVPDEGRVSPPPAAMFGLVMLCSTPAGDAYTLAELDGVFRCAGFTHSELRVPSPGGPQVIISQR